MLAVCLRRTDSQQAHGDDSTLRTERNRRPADRPTKPSEGPERKQPMTDAAAAAAEWWGSHLAPAFQNNGDSSSVGGMAGILGGLLAKENAPSQANIDLFILSLTRRVRERQEASAIGFTALSVDYGPDMVLRDAADEAGVSTVTFPWKTNMTVYPDHVTVSHGYAAPTTLVWTREDYEAKPCDIQAHDPVSYTLLPGKCGQDRYHSGPHDDSVPSPLCATCDRPEHWGTHEGSYTDHEFAAI